MPKQIPQAELDAVLQAFGRYPAAASIEEISGALEIHLPHRTLQRRLALLVEQQRLTVEGRARGSRYRHPPIELATKIVASTKATADLTIYIPVSPEGEAIKQVVRAPIQNRHPVGYNRVFLDAYCPNDTFYLLPETRQRLLELGRSPDGQRPAGTTALKKSDAGSSGRI
jgi:hypothetical protein